MGRRVRVKEGGSSGVVVIRGVGVLWGFLVFGWLFY